MGPKPDRYYTHGRADSADLESTPTAALDLPPWLTG
jgi:hypothetical protein